MGILLFFWVESSQKQNKKSFEQASQYSDKLSAIRGRIYSGAKNDEINWAIFGG